MKRDEKFSYPGVKAYWKGRVFYTFHRKTKTRIHYPPYSAGFAAEVERLDALIDKRGMAQALEATLGWLVHEYRLSPEFTTKRPRTRDDYDRVFYWLRPLDSEPLARITSPDIIAIRDKAFKKKKRTFANQTLGVLSLLFNWGVLHGKAASNPAAKVPKIERPKNLAPQNRRWGEDELEVVMEEAAAIGGGFEVILGFCVYHAMREQDAVAFLRPGYNLKTQTLSWVCLKNGEAMEGVPIDPRMQAILGAYLKVERPFLSPVMAVTRKGQPYTISGFLTLWQRLKAKLVAEGRVRPGLTIHGLRHTAGSTLAEMGFDPRAIANHIGDKSLAMGKLYSEQASKSKSRRQTVRALGAAPQNENESAHNRATDRFSVAHKV